MYIQGKYNSLILLSLVYYSHVVCVIAGGRPASVSVQHSDHTIQYKSKPGNDGTPHVVPEDAVDSPAREATGHGVSVENKGPPSAAKSKGEVKEPRQ